MELSIVNPEGRYSKPQLLEPTRLGYIYVAASVAPGPLPIVLPSAQRAKLVERLTALAGQLEALAGVVKASVFRAIVMPPTSRFSAYLRERGASLHVADFDVAVLVQCGSVDAARRVRMTPAFHALVAAARDAADTVSVLTARNAKRIGDVDLDQSGLFLLNHFAAEDPIAMLELWEYLAGWYVAETGLKNSIGLVPVEGERSDYAIVNWARWDASPVAHFWRQLSRPTFWSYVAGNLDANHAASMPIYHRIA